LEDSKKVPAINDPKDSILESYERDRTAEYFWDKKPAKETYPSLYGLFHSFANLYDIS
jgi:hypothetical protein